MSIIVIIWNMSGFLKKLEKKQGGEFSSTNLIDTKMKEVDEEQEDEEVKDQIKE